MTQRITLVGLLALTLLAPRLAAAQSRERIAVTDPSVAGVDYLFQGEYEGELAGQGWTGLQVVALGLGEFQAVLLDGGLPGSGWNREGKTAYVGKMKDDAVLLGNDDGQIELANNRAWIRNAEGATLGELIKIRRVSPSLGVAPALGSQVLFNNGIADGLTDAKVTEDGMLDVGFNTTDKVQDFQLHVEFRTPFMPNSRGQARGNSGVYIQRRYEVQVLDSFGLDGVANECGGLYKQKAPDLNMCLPPLQWQTYDIFFRAARWEEGKKSESARITVLHNGVAVHNNHAIKSKTGAGKPESPEAMEILFQNHRDPVRFQNLWIIRADTEPSAARSPIADQWAPLVSSAPTQFDYFQNCPPRRVFRRCR